MDRTINDAALYSMTNISANVWTIFDKFKECNHGTVPNSWVTEMDLRWGSLSGEGRSWDSGRAGDAANWHVNIRSQKLSEIERYHF